MAVGIAVQRCPWEASVALREELSVALSNRSAAFLALGDFPAALADADAVVQMRRE